MTFKQGNRITSCNFMKSEFPPRFCLSILRQHSLEVEKFVENGQPKSVHYVVKNSAFVLEVALKNIDWGSSSFPGSGPGWESETLDFNKITLETSLLYDCRDEKEVALVKVQPLTYRGVVKKSNPSVCFLEATIKVLSSQHEDMNFKLKFVAVDSVTKRPLPEIAPVYSEPIQVISKPEVLKKKNQPRGVVGSRKNRTKSELILETLARIESTQVQQQKQIDSILSGAIKPPKTKVLGKRPLCPVDSPFVNSFQSRNLSNAYHQLLTAFRQTPADERASKVQKLMNSSSENDITTWNSFVSLMKPPVQESTPCFGNEMIPPPMVMLPTSSSPIVGDTPPSLNSSLPEDDLFSLGPDDFLATLGFD